MDAKELKRVLESVKESGITELILETSDYKLSVRRGGEAVSAPVAAPQPQTPAAEPSPTPQPQVEAAPAPVPEAPKDVSNFVEITAPIVGTLYAAPSPDAPNFVKVGDKVQAGTVLCIIEAMKLMNEIEAEVSGTVREILVQNAEPVEYGQALFRIEPG